MLLSGSGQRGTLRPMRAGPPQGRRRLVGCSCLETQPPSAVVERCALAEPLAARITWQSTRTSSRPAFAGLLSAGHFYVMHQAVEMQVASEAAVVSCEACPPLDSSAAHASRLRLVPASRTTAGDAAAFARVLSAAERPALALRSALRVQACLTGRTGQCLCRGACSHQRASLIRPRPLAAPRTPRARRGRPDGYPLPRSTAVPCRFSTQIRRHHAACRVRIRMDEHTLHVSRSPPPAPARRSSIRRSLRPG